MNFILRFWCSVLTCTLFTCVSIASKPLGESLGRLDLLRSSAARLSPHHTSQIWLDNVDFAGPFLENEYVTNNIIVAASLNESGTAEVSNCVHFVLLGGVVLTSMHGTNEFVYFNHCPALSTVLVNRGLASLGGWDCEASMLAPVTEKANDINTNMVCDFVEWEKSYPGLLNRLTPIPPGYRPCSDTGSRCAAHNGTLESVESQWRNSTGTYEYAGLYPHDDGFRGTINGIPAIGMQGAVGQPRTRPSESAPTNANANDTKTKSGSLEKLDVARPSLAGLVVGLAFMMLQ